MKYKNIWMTLCALLMIVTTACGSAATETPTPLPPTLAPNTVEPATATPTLVPINLAGPQPGETISWIDGGALVYVPAGDFLMGNGMSNSPTHTISLDAFWIHQTKVTLGMYAQCVKVGSCEAPSQEVGAPQYNNPEFNSYPVVGVTWSQAAAYCAWANGRLPTEAEWEKAARGTDGRTYPWGNDEPTCDIANMLGCFTHSTDTTDFPDGKSPYGAFDMGGNVFEWVSDWYNDTYYTTSPAQNPTGPDSGEYRVIRGSSFEGDLTQAHISTRHFVMPGVHRRDVGFRCVVPNPMPVPPYCQLSAYVPGGTASSFLNGAECQVPQAQVRGQYCSGGDGFATFDIPDGAVYEVQTAGFKCTEATINGQRRVTCKGPRTTEEVAQITVCNPACTGISNTPATDIVTCDPGYVFDETSKACNYAPGADQPNVAGCPVGYALITRGDQRYCAPGRNQNGLCPFGLYFDSAYGACVPVNGQVDIPYGVNKPNLASSLYAECVPGYSYEPTFQCCQPVVGGAYPGCAPGSKFDSQLGACAPGDVRLSGPGCVIVSIVTLQCSQPKDICSSIQSETACLQRSYTCKWDDKINVCMMK